VPMPMILEIVKIVGSGEMCCFHFWEVVAGAKVTECEEVPSPQDPHFGGSGVPYLRYHGDVANPCQFTTNA